MEPVPFFSSSHYYLRLSKPRSETPSQHIQIEFCYGLVKLLYIKNAVQIKYIKSNAYIYVCVCSYLQKQHWLKTVNIDMYTPLHSFPLGLFTGVFPLNP